MVRSRCVGLLGFLALTTPFVSGCTAGVDGAEGDAGSGGSASAGKSSGGTTAAAGTAGAGGSAGSAAGASSAGSAAGGASAGAGGSATGGKATGGSGGGTIIPPPECDAGSTVLPGDAPSLEPGVWKNISPSGEGLSFGGNGNLTQGMTIVPCSPATLYAAICANGGSAAYPKGVYRSTNAGSSWERILADDSPNHIRVDPTNPLNLYVSDGVAGGTAGFYRSTDGGVTWTKKDNMCAVAGITSSCGMNDLYDIGVDPTDFKHVLISFHSPFNWGAYEQGAGILESKDAGENWTMYHYPNTDWGQGHSIDFLYRPDLGIGDSNTWLLGIQNGGGHWRTTDGGTNWDKVSDMSIVHGGGNVYYTADGTLYGSGEPHSIKSTDNGATWSTVENSPGAIGLYGDGKRLYSAGLFATIMQSAPENDDTNWTNYGGETFAAGPFEFAFDSANRIMYTASTGAGVWALKVTD